MTELQVLIVAPDRVMYQGRSSHAVLPGEKGVFEVLPCHKELFSRLYPGVIVLDAQKFPIRRGVVKVALDKITAIVEE